MNGSRLLASLFLVSQLAPDEATKTKPLEKVIGIINDSTPILITTSPPASAATGGTGSNPRVDMIRRASRASMSAILGRLQYDHPELSPVFLASVLAGILEDVVAGVAGPEDWRDPTLDDITYKNWPAALPGKPQLFIYSDGDQICTAAQIESAVALLPQGEGGVPRQMHKFAKSPHCFHYRQNTEKYQEVVRSWLRQALGNGEVAGGQQRHAARI